MTKQIENTVETLGRQGGLWHGELTVGDRKYQFMYGATEADRTSVYRVQEQFHPKMGETFEFLVKVKKGPTWDKVVALIEKHYAEYAYEQINNAIAGFRNYGYTVVSEPLEGHEAEYLEHLRKGLLNLERWAGHLQHTYGMKRGSKRFQEAMHESMPEPVWGVVVA